MKKISCLKHFWLIVGVVILSGCAKNGIYTQSDVNNIKTIKYGVVSSVKEVELEDGGWGALIGGVVGALAGSQVGGGNGKIVAAVAGAGVGTIAGSKFNKGKGFEIIIDTEKNEKNIVVVKNSNVYVGTKVKITAAGEELIEISPVAYKSRPLKKINYMDGKVQKVSYVSNDGKKFPSRFEFLN